MLVGTLLFSIVRWWLITLRLVIVNPWLILKIGILWFFMAFAVSYIFFLVMHTADVVQVRRGLALELLRSCAMSFALSLGLVALYEFIIQNLLRSKFFHDQQHLLQELTFMQHDPEILYKRLCFLMVLLSGLFAAHYVGIMLDAWYDDSVSNRYGWCITGATLICWGFLWSVNYVV